MEYQNGIYQSNSLDALGQSGLAQIGAQAAQEDALSKLLREYRDAKYRFDNACQSAQKAIQERDSATGALEKISQAVEQAVASGRFDPTQPKVTGCTTTATNCTIRF